MNIGSILTLDSIIGKVAKIGLEAAVEDVNNDPTILNGTKLKLTIHDSNFSGFLSIMEGMFYFLTFAYGFSIVILGLILNKVNVAIVLTKCCNHT